MLSRRSGHGSDHPGFPRAILGFVVIFVEVRLFSASVEEDAHAELIERGTCGALDDLACQTECLRRDLRDVLAAGGDAVEETGTKTNNPEFLL